MSKDNEELEEVKEQLKKFLDRSEKDIQGMSKFLKDLSKDANERLKMIEQHLLSYEKKLVELTKINANVEETLLNVLLAIRQNEYLQAWYPAQKGHPEMKVVGAHPCQAKQKV